VRIARLAEGSRIFYARLQGENTIRELSGDPVSGWGEPLPTRSVAALDWLPPCTPSKIVAVGRNYRAHIAELQHSVPEEPLLFMKPPSSLLPTEGLIRLPPQSHRVDYEGELGIVIGRRARCVSEDRALDHVLGYTCLNDVTARDLQRRDVQFTRAKGFDTFCPVGPCLAMGLDPGSLRIATS
jgi:2-keto-4-pentenoate hydratase/2-oxohepta-3-ene-1,7-dioic acid hydratase in catechol pathway